MKIRETGMQCFNQEPMNSSLKSKSNLLGGHWAGAVLALALWSCSINPAAAASTHWGIYSGVFTGQDNGVFWMFVDNNNGRSVLLGFSSTRRDGFYNDDFYVVADGAFSFSANSVEFNGVIGGDSITGSLRGPAGTATLIGNRHDDIRYGAQYENSGYWEGNVVGLDQAAVLKLIMADDGRFAALTIGNNGEDNFWVGQAYHNGRWSLDGGSGQFDSTSHSMSGRTAQGATIYAIRTRWFSCVYTFTPAAVNHGGAGIDEYSPVSFRVNAPGICDWSASATENWIHIVTSGDVYSGYIYYWIEPNPTSGFRTGAITVGNQTESFVITQAPQGYSWSPQFGWLYESGNSWRFNQVFGWMWTSPGGWIWSRTLQGWLGTMGDSRTLWSPQFRWLTPSAGFDGSASTTSIGTIWIGKYNGADLPQGWVVSPRFGYVWAAGDGTWFYSSTYGWLGVTTAGGVWCVNQHRFL